MAQKSYSILPFTGDIQSIPSGWYGGPFGVLDLETQTMATTSRNRCYFQRIVVPIDTQISALSIWQGAVSVGGTTPNWEVALFRDNGLGSRPAGAVWYDPGPSIPTNVALGMRDRACSLLVPAGVWWSACTFRYSVAPTTMPSIYRVTNTKGGLNLPSVSPGTQVRGYHTDAVPAGAWPNCDTDTLAVNAGGPVVWLKAA